MGFGGLRGGVWGVGGWGLGGGGGGWGGGGGGWGILERFSGGQPLLQRNEKHFTAASRNINKKETSFVHFLKLLVFLSKY